MEYGHYRYELSLLPDLGNIRKVEREALYHKPNGKGKWARVFERDEKNVVQGSKMFSLSGLSKNNPKNKVRRKRYLNFIAIRACRIKDDN